MVNRESPRASRGFALALAAATLLGVYAYAAPPANVAAQKAEAMKKIMALPFSFAENAGQITDPCVLYSLAGKDRYLDVCSDGLSFGMLSRQEDGSTTEATFRMVLAGSREVRPQACDRLPGNQNFLGKGRSFVGVPSFSQVTYPQVYPGIDMVLHGCQELLKTEFRLAPGAQPDLIRMCFSGIEGLSINAEGDLVVQTAGGVLVDKAPFTYQEIDGQRVKVESSFRLLGPCTAGYIVGKFDQTRALTIDPDIIWATYFGGRADDLAQALAVGPDGSPYIVYASWNENAYAFPEPYVAAPGYSQLSGTGLRLGVARLSSDASSITYWTWVGTDSNTAPTAICIDANGNAYVAATTGGRNFPLCYPYKGPDPNMTTSEGVVFELSTDGTELFYSTYLGGTEPQQPTGIAHDPNSGLIFVTGWATPGTNQNPLATTSNAYDANHISGKDAFLMVLDKARGSAGLRYSTFLGGSGNDQPTAIALRNGQVYVAGYTASNDFPTAGSPTGPFNSSNAGGIDGFLSIFDEAVILEGNSTGKQLVYSTYFGGINDDLFLAMDVDSDGYVYLAGQTSSLTEEGFPVSDSAYDTTATTQAGFVAKINPAGGGSSDLLYATYIDGPSVCSSTGIAAYAGRAFVAGRTGKHFLVTPSAWDSNDPNNNLASMYLCALSEDGSSLYYSTYVGVVNVPPFFENAYVVTDSNGNAYGATTMNNPEPSFQTTQGTFDPNDSQAAIDTAIFKLHMPSILTTQSTLHIWSDSNSWTNNVPGTNTNAYLESNCTINEANAVALNVYIGPSSVGYLNLVSGSLKVGENLRVGAGNYGEMHLTGGALTVGNRLSVGDPGGAGGIFEVGSGCVAPVFDLNLNSNAHLMIDVDPNGHGILSLGSEALLYQGTINLKFLGGLMPEPNQTWTIIQPDPNSFVVQNGGELIWGTWTSTDSKGYDPNCTRLQGVAILSNLTSTQMHQQGLKRFDAIRDYDPNTSCQQLTIKAVPLHPGDANGDGYVDGVDFLIWQSHYPTPSGATWDMGDFNHDGKVDGDDFLIWQSNQGVWHG